MHPLQLITVAILNSAIMFKVFDLMINSQEFNHSALASFGFKNESAFVSLLIFSKLYEIVGWMTEVFQIMYVRRCEF
jgi:hypothetical protein